MPNVCPSHDDDDDDDDQQSGRACRKLWEKNTAFALQCGMHMLLFLGQAKCCVVLLRRSHCFRVKRDQEVRRVKYNVYRCFIVGRGAAAAADVASPVKSVPGEKRVSTSQATVVYSIIVRKRRDWKHG